MLTQSNWHVRLDFVLVCLFVCFSRQLLVLLAFAWRRGVVGWVTVFGRVYHLGL